MSTHDKEAQALKQIRVAIKEDGRLSFHKSAEGARLDFGVCLPGNEARALGVQLKTSTVRNLMGAPYYLFNKTNGYNGAALVCMSVEPTAPRVWLLSGSQVQMRSLSIAVRSVKRSSRRAFTPVEISLAQLPQQLLQILQGDAAEYSRGSLAAIITPSSPTRLKEYLAFKLLQRRLPLIYTEPDVEARHYDFLVEDSRWQLKMASTLADRDCYQVPLHKYAGRREGRNYHQKYAHDDFDWLCIQMPESLPIAYLIPATQLVMRGLVGGSEGGATIYLYPSRTPSRTGANWADDFALDLRSPAAALQDYERIRRANAKRTCLLPVQPDR